MDKNKKKALLRAWRASEREKARAAFPISVDDLKELFDVLDRELQLHGCNRTRRRTEAWLRENGHDVAATFAWLDEHNGFCDCTILANVEQHVHESLERPVVDRRPN